LEKYKLALVFGFWLEAILGKPILEFYECVGVDVSGHEVYMVRLDSSEALL